MPLGGVWDFLDHFAYRTNLRSNELLWTLRPQIEVCHKNDKVAEFLVADFLVAKILVAEFLVADFLVAKILVADFLVADVLVTFTRFFRRVL